VMKKKITLKVIEYKVVEVSTLSIHLIKNE